MTPPIRRGWGLSARLRFIEPAQPSNGAGAAPLRRITLRLTQKERHLLHSSRHGRAVVSWSAGAAGGEAFGEGLFAGVEHAERRLWMIVNRPAGGAMETQ